MSSAQEIYAMLGQSALWETASECHALLESAEIPHAVVGGLAVCLHGYQRNTIDVDMLIRPDDAHAAKQILIDAGFTWDEERCEFRSPQHIPVQFLRTNDHAGASDAGLKLPDPGETGVVSPVENLPAIALSKLIEMKIACGQRNIRRMHKDFADVVELICCNQLRRDYARYLHKSVRKVFRDLVLKSRGEL